MTKILVIEDNQTIREEVLTWLSLEDYEALGAANGRKGIEIALQQLPDLIISDIMMPDKDGYRVLLELRAQPTTALTPFIFLTAKQEKNDIRHGMELGADDYITKPFGREELLRAIQTRLTRRGLLEKYSDQKGKDLRRHLIHMLPHELRTPLVGIMGIGELLHREAQFLTPDEIVEYAGLITVSGERLYRLIENHLLYAQLEIYAADPKTASLGDGTALEPVDPLIKIISEQLAHAYNRTGDLQLDLQPGAVRMPKEYLSKVVYELVDNAFKFSKAATQVRVTSNREAEKYVFSISDQGRGMSSEQIDCIDAYVQFDRSTHEQQGAGLGLTLARRLAELYDGNLQVASIPGVGITVQVTLSTL